LVLNIVSQNNECFQVLITKTFDVEPGLLEFENVSGVQFF